MPTRLPPLRSAGPARVYLVLPIPGCIFSVSRDNKECFISRDSTFSRAAYNSAYSKKGGWREHINYLRPFPSAVETSPYERPKPGVTLRPDPCLSPFCYCVLISEPARVSTLGPPAWSVRGEIWPAPSPVSAGGRRPNRFIASYVSRLFQQVIGSYRGWWRTDFPRHQSVQEV
jgi:hypothetical protein